MKQISLEIDGLMLLEPKVFGDNRGFFMETFHGARYESLGLPNSFVQDNLSFSDKGIIRGLHFQMPPKAQGKLIQVVTGEVFDVAVDIRPDSPTFGKSESVILSGENKRQFYIPPGFAHGFCTLTNNVLFSYKCTDYYSPENERALKWNDSDIGINWPIQNPILSEKDKEGGSFKKMVNELERITWEI